MGPEAQPGAAASGREKQKSWLSNCAADSHRLHRPVYKCEQAFHRQGLDPGPALPSQAGLGLGGVGKQGEPMVLSRV